MDEQTDIQADKAGAADRSARYVSQTPNLYLSISQPQFLSLNQ